MKYFEENNLISNMQNGFGKNHSFFLVYINDVQGILSDINYRLYADDTVIYCSGKDYIVLQKKLQLALNTFSKWCKENALSINTSKTKFMTFGSRSIY